MNLYLSSYRLGAHPEHLRQLAASTRAAVVANAMDFVSEADRRQAVAREVTDLEALGFTADELDLRDYFETGGIAEKVSAYGLVWARGGNSFLLRQAMNRSGFDAALEERLADNAFVYAGYSAGIVVLAPSLRGIEIVDPVDVAVEGYDPDPIWDGLGILEYHIAPHYESDHPESEAIGKVVEYFERHEMPYRALRDGEAILVRRGEESVV